MARLRSRAVFGSWIFAVSCFANTTRTSGKSTGALCERIHADQGELGIRSIQGVLALAKKFGASPVDEACKAALDVGLPQYRVVRRWLDHHPPQPLMLRHVDPLIRELSHYRDVINRQTRKENG